MPRVGSSMMKMRVPTLSQRARTTFCWLPPLMLTTRKLGVGVLMRSSWIIRLTRVSSFPKLITPRRVSRLRPEIVVLIRTLSWRNSPWAFRSSVTRATPLRIAAAGECGLYGLPGDAHLAAGRVRAEDRAHQLGPPRSDDAREPDDLAGVQLERDVPQRASTARGRSPRAGLRRARPVRFGYTSFRSRPIMSLTRSSIVTSATRCVAT